MKRSAEAEFNEKAENRVNEMIAPTHTASIDLVQRRSEYIPRRAPDTQILSIGGWKQYVPESRL